MSIERASCYVMKHKNNEVDNILRPTATSNTGGVQVSSSTAEAIAVSSVSTTGARRSLLRPAATPMVETTRRCRCAVTLRQANTGDESYNAASGEDGYIVITSPRELFTMRRRYQRSMNNERHAVMSGGHERWRRYVQDNAGQHCLQKGTCARWWLLARRCVIRMAQHNATGDMRQATRRTSQNG